MHKSAADHDRRAALRQSPTATRAPYFGARDLSLIGVFAALIAAFGVMPAIPIGGIGVPITLQTLAVVLTGLILGPLRGFAAAGLYVVVGLIGLPIFANFSGGPGVLVGPSGGYVVSFPFVAAAAGALAIVAVRKAARARRIAMLITAGLVGGVVVGHAFGMAGMMVNLHLSVPAAFAADVVFVPGDVVKVVIAALIAASVHRAFPDLLRRR
ncbi:biotin transporter BioY [Spelaeicoccus albus]|uniref:Biotin transporter n=1 Tax=Spelaeicoccus albus TaxID=1280376 RepID=A0A7Z0D404_9MICO|nr:biotin transporter BioY [Spelaeicoccus albus]NYI68454.1 biotin transport system substrate-specific component [Spelaeicoccus albus]